jgi:putative ABC transport system permease protein
VQHAMLASDARMRYVRSLPLAEMLEPELRQWSLGATLFTLFGGLALLVAAIGLYSVLAFDVAQRVREIGLRTALGASTRAIMNLVISRAVRITSAGVICGAALALVLAPRLGDMLYGVGPRDPLTFGIVIVSLGLVSLIASGVPAWRASRVDPNIALRAD